MILMSTCLFLCQIAFRSMIRPVSTCLSGLAPIHQAVQGILARDVDSTLRYVVPLDFGESFADFCTSTFMLFGFEGTHYMLMMEVELQQPTGSVGEGVIAERSDCDPAEFRKCSLLRMVGETLGCRSGFVLCQGYDWRSDFA